MHTLSEKIERLKSCALFEALSYAELKAVSLAASEVTCASGEIVFREGEPGDDAYLLLAGEAEAVATLKNGRTVLLATFRRNDLFGEFSLLSNCPRTATVVATTDLRALCFQKDAFLEIVTRSPAVALKIMDFLVKRLLRTQERLLEVIASGPPNRQGLRK